MDIQSIIFSIDGREDILNKIIYEVKLDDTISVEKGSANLRTFSDNELCPDFNDSVRGKRVFLLSSPNTSSQILMLNFAIDAAKRAGAKEIIPIIPYFPYARADKKDQNRGPIGAKVIAEMLENRGATTLVTFDLHAAQIQGFFNIPVIHMEGKHFFDEYISKVHRQHGNVVLCAPDAGAAKRVKGFKRQLIKKYGIDLPYVVIDKTREEANKVGSMELIGNVKDKNVIIIDDLSDTSGTLCKAADTIISEGAKTVRAMVTHGVLSGPAFKNIANSKLHNFVCSDSLSVPKTVEVDDGENVKSVPTEEVVYVISCTTQIVKAIKAINQNISVEALKSE